MGDTLFSRIREDSVLLAYTLSQFAEVIMKRVRCTCILLFS